MLSRKSFIISTPQKRYRAGEGKKRQLPHQARIVRGHWPQTLPPGGRWLAVGETDEERRNVTKSTIFRENCNGMERNKSLKTNSQNLRKNQTKEERLLWNAFLRKYPVTFRRQYVIGNFIVDFYCHQAKLAIELDGSQHWEPVNLDHDQRRSQYLESLGIQVLRFSNLDITRQFRSVCQVIDETVTKRVKKQE